MSDLALTVVDNCINLSLTEDGSTLLRDDGLESAVIISLFTDQRVAASEVPEGTDSSQQGWWGDLISDLPGDQVGSRLWTLNRSKALPEVLQSFQVRARQSLQWLIDDGVASVVNVTGEFDDNQAIVLTITITRPQESCDDIYGFVWDGQSLKRS